MTRNEAREQISAIGILPSIRVSVEEHILFGAETIYAAGIPVVEVTMTSPGAIKAIGDLAARYPDMVIGAGTVLDEQAAQQCVEAGARFLTSPGFVPEVVAYACKHEVVSLPGAMTPSEVIAAWKAGADFVKIFPSAPIGGDQYVRALKIPLPQVPFIATGGVNQLRPSITSVLVRRQSVWGRSCCPRRPCIYGRKIASMSWRGDSSAS